MDDRNKVCFLWSRVVQSKNKNTTTFFSCENVFIKNGSDSKTPKLYRTRFINHVPQTETKKVGNVCFKTMKFEDRTEPLLIL